MRRRTGKSLANFLLFSTALILVLYLNRPYRHATYAWTEVRYRTTSSTLPPSRGVCPGLSKTTKPALVVARVEADGSPNWLDALADLYHLCIYTVDAPSNPKSKYLQVPANRGHEAMAYLTFIIDNYNTIPAAGAVFVHGSRFAWHNDHPQYDNKALLLALNVSAALTPLGYHNLRCDWSASTCSPFEAPPQGSLETSVRAMLEPWNRRVVSDKALPGALAIIFGGDEIANGENTWLGRGDAVRSQCCAQFVVSRESVQRREKAEYIALRQWLLDGSRSNAAPSDDRIAGRILSYIWQILFIPWEPFGEQDPGRSTYSGIDLSRLNVLACPGADECYCRLYGWCNLDGCTNPGSCRGQYHLPQDLKLPDDWAATHP